MEELLHKFILLATFNPKNIMQVYYSYIFTVKFVSKSHISNNLCSTNKNLEYAQAEIKILRKCNSSHILKIIDVFYYNN
jgi:hypothetical protein